MGKTEEAANYILARHKEAIEKAEARSLSRLRQIISPYSEYVLKLKAELLSPLAPYIKEEHLPKAAERILAHCARIETISLPVQFAFSFEEIEKFGAASFLDKALLAASLLRAAGSEDAAVSIGSAGTLVKFSFDGKQFALDLEKNRMLSGDAAEKFIERSDPTYVFSDLFFAFTKKS